MLRKKRREVPGLNTSSTADISFMLLIFFLVTTSMEVDWGMQRQMPPYEPDKKEKTDVDRTKVITLHLTADGKVAVDEETVYDVPFTKESARKLRRQLKEFIAKVGPTHIIELKTDGEVEYEEYFALQNQLMRSYREIRDAAARNMLGKPYARCPKDDRDRIVELYPQRIQEVVQDADTSQE